MALRHTLIDAGLKGFAWSRIDRLLAPLTRGRGAILAFHRVEPRRDEAFQPNRLLSITPEFLDALLVHLKRSGTPIVPLDAVLPMLRSARQPPFVALTFDDGYRDTLTDALPVLERHQAPFTVFAATGFLDRTARLWWVELEDAIRASASLDVPGMASNLSTVTPAEKSRAFEALRRSLLTHADVTLLSEVASLCRQAGISGHAIVDRLCMDWNELVTLAAHPLATVGCHTVEHPRLALMTDAGLWNELEGSRRELEARLGRPVQHLCYPYGWRDAAGAREFTLARDLGFATAVTTRPGLLWPAHAHHPTALPRISVNGLWQDTRMLDVLLSGMAVLLWNRGRRIDVR